MISFSTIGRRGTREDGDESRLKGHRRAREFSRIVAANGHAIDK